MKIDDWSVVPTPDALGLALKPMFEDEYEVCVSMRQGRIVVNIHKDGQDKPLATMIYNIKGEEA